jgi:probable F420-dependent oxidoreductase
MVHPRKFRFGVQLSSATSGDDWVAKARQAEDLGFSTLFLPDHFGPQLAPVPAMMAAASATTDLRVGCLVFDNDYKHPVVLAKEIATIDVLSGGRVELGIGAGWMNSDYEQSGIRHDRAGVRIDRMEEGIAVLKGLFADGAYSFEGDHYRITGLDGQPKPVQRPHPPFLIGGGGQRVLTIAGREADIVGINPAIVSGAVDADAARNGAAAETDQKLEWVKKGAGDRYADLELNMLIFAAMITDDPAGTKAQMAPLFGLEGSDLDDYPHALIGTVDSITEDLQRRRDRWDVSYIVVQGDAMDAIAPVVAKLAGT